MAKFLQMTTMPNFTENVATRAHKHLENILAVYLKTKYTFFYPVDH